MRQSRSRQARRGAIVPLVAVSLIAVLGMVALAIDIGMVAVAKTQAQNAADSAASAGARSLNQQTGYNLSGATVAAVTAATQNKIFNTNIPGDPTQITNPVADTYVSGQVTIQCGGYYYVYNDANPAAEAFNIVVPGKSATEPYTAIRATINSTSPVFFGAVFGTSAFNVTAHAVAAHRPRDVVIIMDLSGSMRFQSCPAGYYDGTYLYPHWGARNKSLNPDTNYPTFGHYSDTVTAALYGNTSYSTGAEMVDPANGVVTSNSGPPCITDIMTSGSTLAFSATPASQATTPGGDNYIKAGGNYAKTVSDIVGANPTITKQVDWCRNGYSSATYNGGATFNGYTEGPGYWGKTFFIWPPDPRGSDLDPTNAANHADNGAKDWRQRFFFKKNNSTGTLYWLDNNNIIFNPSGQPATTDGGTSNFIKKAPNTTTTVTEDGQTVTYRYCINYAAIFQWLRNTAPTHFPASITTGRIKYYTTIPDPTGDNNFNTRFWAGNPMADLNERFWKDYVDFMLGFVASGANTYSNNDGNNPYTAYIGNGDYYPWGTMQIKQKPDSNFTATVNNSGGYSKGTTPTLSFNNVKKLDGTSYDLPGPQPVTGATNATPIVITSAGHGLTIGNTYTLNIAGVLGNTAANGTFKVTVLTSSTFSLQTTGGSNVAGTGTYTANTGSWVPAITAASGTPIVITTGAPHNLPTSLPTSSSASATPTLTVNISGVTGNTAANGKWTVTVNNSTQFTLTNSTGGGTFSSNPSQWWEPVFYVRFGTQSTFYELNPALTTSGILTATPDIALAGDVANSTSVKIYTTVPKYMDYADNPYRPRHHLWFGPQSWLDWLGNYSIGNYPNGTNGLRWPGNTHEAQAWACKVGISSAIDDIKNNHPNDYVGMCFFSSPNYNTSGGGQFNTPVVPLGRNYQNLKDSLWFPPSTVAGAVSTITPYDADFANVPRAHGGTAPGMGFMLAYNLLSSSATNLRSYATPTTTYRGYDGGLGRKGAARLVIFETDGSPNTRAFANLTTAGADSYYPVRFKAPADVTNGSNEFPTGGSYNSDNVEVTNVVKQIVALNTDSPPGYSTVRKTAMVYSLGYGTMFDPNNKSNTTAQNNALAFLQTVQYYGNVNTAGGTTAANFPDWQRIYGDTITRQTRLQSAFTTIMQSGVQVSLIE